MRFTPRIQWLAGFAFVLVILMLVSWRIIASRSSGRGIESVNSSGSEPSSYPRVHKGPISPSPSLNTPPVEGDLQKAKQHRDREGNPKWFLGGVLFPLIQRVNQSDPNGATRVGMDSLLVLIRKDAKTFRERMEQAAAVRLIPYSIRGNEGLVPEAISILKDLFSSAQTQLYTRMSALASLYGFQLNYNVRPFVSGAPEIADKEVYSMYYDTPLSRDEPDTYHFRRFTLQDVSLRRLLRNVIGPGNAEELTEVAIVALALEPSAEDRISLYEALAIEELDFFVKKMVLNSLVAHPGPETVLQLMALQVSAETSGNGRLTRGCKEALVRLGVTNPTVLTECLEVIQGQRKDYTWIGAVDLVTQIHLHSESSNARAVLESLLVSDSLPERLSVIRKIVEHNDRAMLDALQCALDREQAEEVRKALEEAVAVLGAK